MDKTFEIVDGLRAAIQELLVPKLRAWQIETRRVREALERNERRLERINQNFALLRAANNGFSAFQRQTDERFVQVLSLIQNLQYEFAIMNQKIEYGKVASQARAAAGESASPCAAQA